MSRRTPHKPARSIHPLLQKAVTLHRAGNIAEAIEAYEAIIAQVPNHFDATHLLGVIALQEGRLEQAQELIRSALRISPKDHAALNNLGMVYLRKGDIELACGQFERAVKIQPNFSDGLANLGGVLRQLGRSRDALVPLRRAYSHNPQSAAVCNLIGACLMDTAEPHEAVKFFEAATLAEPDVADGWSNLSIALNSAGELGRAQDCALKAVALSPESSAALAARAAVEFEDGQIDTAIETYREAIALPDPSTQTYCAFGNALWVSGRCEEALDYLRQAVAMDSNSAMARWKLALSQCRSFYDTPAEMEASRKDFAESLEHLQVWFRTTRRQDAYRAVGSTQPFYFAYHPLNNRELLTRYGDMCTEWMASMPTDVPLVRDRQPEGARYIPAAERKMRIGIASAHIRNHSVWNALTKGWVHNLDKECFDIWLFQLGRIDDEEAAQARHIVARFEEGPKSEQAWARTICEAQLDVLIYPDIGMDALTTQLASLRLAPVQATTWGHPETSGLSTIDLYLSADAFEPAEADGNYRERLVRLPNLGVCVEPLSPEITIPDLRSLGLPGDEPLLLCPGTPFKYTPEYDHVWARIAKGLEAGSSNKRGWSRIAGRLLSKGNGRLVFFRSNSQSMDELLARRLRRAFDIEKVDFDAHVRVIPRLDRSRFFGLMQQSALLLDTMNFSGFNNALQAIEAGLPVLARESAFMRGRLASGIMRRIGLPELVAMTDDAFIQSAVELSANASKLSELRLEIANRRAILFHDTEAVRGLERCLMEAIGRTRSLGAASTSAT